MHKMNIQRANYKMVEIQESEDEYQNDDDQPNDSDLKLELSQEQSCDDCDEDENPTSEFDPLKLSKIIVADDQDINLAVLKEFFGSLNVNDVTYCINGQTAIDTCNAVLNEAIVNAADGVSL